MKFYEASSVIKAEPKEIWAVLTDGPRFPEWDSGVTKFEGRIAPGEKIKVSVAANPGRAFPVTVTSFEPERTMRWTGGMPLGLFKGVRTYTLTPQPDGTTTFTMREEYTGPMLPLIWRSIPDLGPSFTQFANGLKQRVENGS
jgi:hypothetical protein